MKGASSARAFNGTSSHCRSVCALTTARQCAATTPSRRTCPCSISQPLQCTLVKHQHSTHSTHQQRGAIRTQASAWDVMPTWTLDQIAGLAFGGVMVAFLVLSKQVDIFIARAQRRQLGLCEECGGVFEPGTCQVKNCPAKQSSTLKQ